MDEEKIRAAFVQSVMHRRLLYLKYVKFLGHPVNDEEISASELDVYPELKALENGRADSVTLCDFDELRLLLWMVDPPPDDGSGFYTKAVLFRFQYTRLIMRPENNHQRPHFHIEYKQEYAASYAIDNLERLAGNIPAKYEKPIMKWASPRQDLLKKAWDKLQAGEHIQELLFEAEKET